MTWAMNPTQSSAHQAVRNGLNRVKASPNVRKAAEEVIRQREAAPKPSNSGS